MSIELLQDFTMPDICNRIKVSEDGQYVIATGTYKPRIKCYDVSALSLKFERCLDADVIDFLLFTEDYRKMVFLEEERYLEFHNQGGRWYRTRIPKFGRDLAYHYPSCDLYIAASGFVSFSAIENEIYRMNLLEGRFGNSLFIGSESANKCVFNPVHYLLTIGTNDGMIEAWDPRSRQRVGLLDCTLSMVKENVHLPYYKSVEELGITSLAYGDGLNLAVGTYTGQVLLYDIRSRKPYFVKNKLDDSPIITLEYLKNQNVIYSLSKDSLNIWDSNTGKPYTSIESGVKYNDMCSIPGSGMIFIAAETPKMESYFIPSLGPAPKWCGHLDALVEELEEEEIPASYDDYKFVTENELTLLGLDTLIGTNCLRAVMHGYYIDMRLYNKAKSAVNLLDKETLLKQKVRQKITQQKDNLKTKRKQDSKSVPNVNQEAFLKLQDEINKGGEKSSIAKGVLEDPRFASLFSKSEFNIDKESESFKLIQPLGSKAGERFRQMQDSDEEEGQDSNTKLEESQDEDEYSSDVDSVISSIEGERYEDVEEEIETPVKQQKRSKIWTEKKSKNSVENVKNYEEGDGGEVSDVRERGIRAAETWNDLEEDWLTLGELLEEQEANEVEINEHSYGSREMKFTLETAPNRFEKLRKQQMEHHKLRKERVRRTHGLKGKIRMNKS
ncbi:Nucleolar protein 10 [Armadillidium nasatum]|uniref:Nucleolar protein 10 n=1 Tax=Armadillidium nasatum TaxID=96803 RepID=A0A5N5SNF3_9CRUS|nr:Nucleolar protein 10 [Armadillidium nasatum]